MSEPSFVTVATYTMPQEADMAKGLLETEGIAAQVFGGAVVTPMNYGVGGLVQLQVAADDAERALALLHAQQERVRRNDWEDEPEEDVWVCSLCGTPVSKDLLECVACRSPRDALQTGPGARANLR